MKYLEQFDIAFVGLSLGTHNFQFEIDGEFFGNFELSEIDKASVAVHVILGKEERMLTFDFHMDGYAELVCDRCLDNYQQPISNSERLYVKFGSEAKEESEDVIIISSTDHKINLGQYIYTNIFILKMLKESQIVIRRY